MAVLLVLLTAWYSQAPQHPPVSEVSPVATQSRTIDLGDDYQLEFSPPAGWSVSEIGDGITLSIPETSINLDWWKPHRGRNYERFSARISAELRQTRQNEHDVHIRRFHIGDLDAAEIRYTTSINRVVVETYLGVPSDDAGTSGELFVIGFDGPNTAAGRSHLRAYRTLIRSMRITLK